MRKGKKSLAMPQPPTEKRKRKLVKLNKIEKAILFLAEYMEDPNHDQYRIKTMVLDILGLEEIKQK